MKEEQPVAQHISKLYSEIKRERVDFASPQRANHLLRAQALLVACPWWIVTNKAVCTDYYGFGGHNKNGENK